MSIPDAVAGPSASSKPTADSYRLWLRTQRGVPAEELAPAYYESVVEKIRRSFAESPFWRDVVAHLGDFNDEFRAGTGYPLLTSFDAPALLTKPHRSFIEKTYRKNCILNSSWPDPPPDGWLLPANWYTRTNDTVRTALVVKYLDGVQFLLDKLRAMAELHRLHSDAHFEARDEGYYAAHFYVTDSFEVPNVKWDTRVIAASVEVQITTQLQDVIRMLLHKYYETRRMDDCPGPEWKWDYRCDEFATNYLGHILHYVEGMVMDIRQRQSKKGKP